MNYKTILHYFFPLKYEKAVVKYSIENRLDPYLVYSIIKVESKFDTYAISPKGAMGLMQITPPTGRYIATLLEDKKYKQEMLYDPEKNIKFGCFYISKLYKDFNGDIDSALAAYNGGEGNVRKWLKTDETGKKYLNTEEVPFAETRDYIKKVKRNYKIYKFLYTK
jgi:soluble lytic murein transglycosylase